MTVDTVYKRDQVIQIINSVLGKINAPETRPYGTLATDLTELRSIIESLRVQLSESRAGDINSTHIPNATDELDAVLAATETATQDIMQSCENILEIAQGQPAELFGPIEENVIKVFEACTFQDITGQRIKKVAKCLTEIEEKTNSILKVLEVEETEPAQESDDGDKLLNGPALPQEAMSQDDIDKLLSEFDV